MNPPAEKPSGPIGLVIFGATGDLTARKLMPALYQLAQEKQLPERTHIIGMSRTDWSDEQFREEMRTAVKEFSRDESIDDGALDALLQGMHYVPTNYKDGQGFEQLGKKLNELGADNRLFYLATPPASFPVIVEHIGKAKLAHCPQGWTRIIIEKPYGQDLQSARELDQAVHSVFEEDQVFRIDHFLGKETVQNILVFRFANGIFEPLWNRRYIDAVQVTMAETIGVGDRGGYYDEAGVIKDIFQNHLIQLLALTAMEAPVAFTAEAVRNEKVKVLQALHPLTGQDAIRDTVRAQYRAGSVDGEQAPGYRELDKVAKDSTTETLMAAKVHIDNWRWAGVPFYMRSGKRLAERSTQIVVQYKQVPLSLFGARNFAGDAPNRLVINIQPEEGITLDFGAKRPGPENQIEGVSMDFRYAEAFGDDTPEAYERLLMDCINGDATLFTRSDEVQAAWAYVDGILAAWQAAGMKELPQYAPGSWGPPEMDEFIRRDGFEWRNGA